MHEEEWNGTFFVSLIFLDSLMGNQEPESIDSVILKIPNISKLNFSEKRWKLVLSEHE